LCEKNCFRPFFEFHGRVFVPRATKNWK
jgi:hypothetical protein